MKSVSRGMRRLAAASVLVVLLGAPTAFASNTTSDASLWDEFVAWLAGQSPDQDGFIAWLNARIDIPGG